MASVILDTIRSIAGTSVTSSYQNFGTALTKNWRMMRCVNNSDGDVFLSLDGVHNQIIVPAYSFVLYDFATNALNVQDTDWFVLPIGAQFQIKYSSEPSTGTIYLEGVFSTGV